MLARQFVRTVARRRVKHPYVAFRTFLEVGSDVGIVSRETQRPTNSIKVASPNASSVDGPAEDSIESSDSDHTSTGTQDRLAASATDIAASLAMQPPRTSTSTSTRSPNAAHRKLVQREAKRASRTASEEKTSRSGIDNTIAGQEFESEQIITPSRKDKGKGRALDEAFPTDSTNANTEGHSVAADGPKSFAEYASRNTPVSNSLFVTQPATEGPSFSRASGDSPLNGGGELMLATTNPSGPSSSNSEQGQASSSSSNPFGNDGTSGSADDSQQSNGLGFLPFIPLRNVPVPQIRHPFNTYRFVSRLERDGVFERDTAEEIMKATKALLLLREQAAASSLVAKADVENEAYLFSAALSELRTEVQMTARTDAIALRSLGSQLQREVDALGQKMREDMNNLRNDNQLDLNNRKDEANADIAAIEQKILDLNSKFSLLMGDTRASLEASKWVQTRRSIGKSRFQYMHTLSFSSHLF